MVKVKSRVNARAHTHDKTPENPAKPYIFCPDENLHSKSAQNKLPKLVTKGLTSTLTNMAIAP